MPQTPITTQKELDDAKNGNGVFEKGEKTKMDTPPETIDPETDKDTYFLDAAEDAVVDVGSAETEVDDAAAAAAADQGEAPPQPQTPPQDGNGGAAAGSGNIVYDTLNDVVKEYEGKLVLNKTVPKKFPQENGLTDELITEGVLKFCKENKRAAPGGGDAAAQGGGRRRSKRRQPKRSAKQSKKGGRSRKSGSKNHRKQSRRRKH